MKGGSMVWNFSDDLPIYQQIMDIVKRQIATGEWKPGEKLPSVREMALGAGVNPNTMQKALSEMEREGFLYSQRTAGRFVTEDKAIIKGLQEGLVVECVDAFLKNMQELGFSIDEIIELIRKEEKKEEK